MTVVTISLDIEKIPSSGDMVIHRNTSLSNVKPKLIIIIMVIFKCYFSRDHIVLSYKKWCEHRIRKNKQSKSTAHDGKSYLK